MKLSKIILLLSSLTVSYSAIAGERLYLELPVQFSPNVFIVPRVKSECEVERLMSEDAEAGITKRFGPIESSAIGQDVANGKVIKLTILNVDGIGGGGWTGPKSMTVLAEVKQGDQVLAAKMFSRASKGANPFAGTCSILNNVTKAVGADVGVWLKRGAANGAQETAEKTTDDPT